MKRKTFRVKISKEKMKMKMKKKKIKKKLEKFIFTKIPHPHLS